MLKGVTISGNVMFCATERGTPTWSIRKFGSGVMTVRAEKSTRFPIKLPRIRPSLPFKRAFSDFSGFPDFCIALKQNHEYSTSIYSDNQITLITHLGNPGISLSTRVATWNCNILIFSDTMWAAAPLCSFLNNSLLHLIMSVSYTHLTLPTIYSV